MTKYYDNTSKGMPDVTSALSLQEIAQQNWNLLNEDINFPCAVIKEPALTHNRHFMRHYCEHHQVQFCPHGKTTMSPQLWEMQLDDGAWGITVASSQQLVVAAKHGIKRIFLANQLVGKQAYRSINACLQNYPQLEIYCLIDSLAHLQLLANVDFARPLHVLIEIGIAQGRTGLRHQQDINELINAIKLNPQLILCGIEVFEGIIHSDDIKQDELQLETLLQQVNLIATQYQSEFMSDNLIISAGGSAYFDLVVKHYKQLTLNKPSTLVLRSGCYLVHDHGFYQAMLNHSQQRDTYLNQLQPALQGALEVWGYVQSLPEKNLAITNFGKRDCSYDIDLPIPIWHYQQHHKQLLPLSEHYQVKKLDDQHAYISIPDQHDLAIGDLVAVGISHPCTTFDKWQLLFIVNEQYTITQAIETQF